MVFYHSIWKVTITKPITKVLKITFVMKLHFNKKNLISSNTWNEQLNNINEADRVLINKKGEMNSRKQLLLTGSQRTMHAILKGFINFQIWVKFSRTDHNIINTFSFSYTKIYAFHKIYSDYDFSSFIWPVILPIFT